MVGVGAVVLGAGAIGTGARIELEGGVAGNAGEVCGSKGNCGTVPWSSMRGDGGVVSGSDAEPREGPVGAVGVAR